MNTVLLVAATAKEINPFLEYYRSDDGPPMDINVLISGIGLTATSYHLQKQLHLQRPDLVIQVGVAGCFDTKRSLGSVLAVKKEAIADQSVIELKKLKTLFDLQLVPEDQFPFKKGWLVNDHDILKKTKLPKVTGVSVNEITTSKEKIKFYKDTFDPVVESMEGAALHYTCIMEKIPFLQLRSVSNYIGERDKKKWDMKQSIVNLNDALIDLIENL
jgi:futalosine hydrolase